MFGRTGSRGRTCGRHQKNIYIIICRAFSTSYSHQQPLARHSSRAVCHTDTKVIPLCVELWGMVCYDFCTTSCMRVCKISPLLGIGGGGA